MGLRASQKLRVMFEGPCNEDYNVLGSIWGPPYLGKPPLGMKGL